MKNTDKKKFRVEITYGSHVFSDDVFHIIFDNVLLKDSVQISRYFIKRSLASSGWHFPILLLYFDHRLMKVLLIISGGKYVPRVFVWRPGPGCSKHG